MPLKGANASEAVQGLKDRTQRQVDEDPHRVREGGQFPRDGFRRGIINAARRLLIQVDADGIGAKQSGLPAVLRTHDAANLDTQGTRRTWKIRYKAKSSFLPRILRSDNMGE